jgi:membrane protein implicated in regulation of membrane protease activity
MVSIFQAVLAFFVAPPREEPPHRREGKIARVIEPKRTWQVRHQATYWSARSRLPANFRPGDLVRVVKQEGSLLWIEPWDTEE